MVDEEVGFRVEVEATGRERGAEGRMRESGRDSRSSIEVEVEEVREGIDDMNER